MFIRLRNVWWGYVKSGENCMSWIGFEIKVWGLVTYSVRKILHCRSLSLDFKAWSRRQWPGSCILPYNVHTDILLHGHYTQKQLIRNISNIARKLRNKSYSARKNKKQVCYWPQRNIWNIIKLRNSSVPIKKQLSTIFHFQIIVKLTMLILDGFGNL